MWLLLGITVFGSVLVTAWYYWKPFVEHHRLFTQSEFVAWAIKGLGGPALVWVVMDSGAMWSLGPFMRKLSIAKDSSAGWAELMTGLTVLASWWLALSLGWLTCVLAKNIPDENRGNLRAHAIFWSFVTIPVAGLIVLLGGLAAGGFAASICLLPIVHCTSPLLVKRKTPTFYSAAIARMKLGKPEQAEAEILKQLEQAEDDYDGWMMLAQVYAEHYHDLDTADRTVRDLCAQPDLNPGQVYMALNKLANWH